MTDQFKGKMTEDFIKHHDVKSVKTRYVNGGSLLVIEFNDGRVHQITLMDADIDRVLDVAFYVIIENSIIVHEKEK